MVAIYDPESQSYKDTGFPVGMYGDTGTPTTNVDFMIRALYNPGGDTSLPSGQRVSLVQARNMLGAYGYNYETGPQDMSNVTSVKYAGQPTLPSGAPNPTYIAPTPQLKTGSQEWWTSEIAKRDAEARANTGADPQQILNKMALALAEKRPGYYDPSGLGDAKTQERMNLLSKENPSYDKNTLAAIALNEQLVAAYKTPGTRDDLFYSTELRKASLNPNEVSSAYHYMGKKMGIPIPANPFEYQGDIGVQIVAGTPISDKQTFSPVSLLAASKLPGGMGIADYQWETAKNQEKGRSDVLTPDFTQAISFFAQAEDQYGPYGSLYGGPSYIGSPSSEGIRKQADFVLTGESVARVPGYETALATPSPQTVFNTSQIKSDRLVGSGKVASVATIESIGDLPKWEDYKNKLSPAKQAMVEWGIGSSKFASDEYFKRTEEERKPTYLTYSGGIEERTQRALINTALAVSRGDIGKAYESFEMSVVPKTTGVFMPDISGISVNTGDWRQVAAKQIYTDIREYPVQSVALVGIAPAFKLAEVGAVKGISYAAMSGKPIISTAGRVLSTPFAADIGRVGIKGGIAAVFAYESGKSVLEGREESQEAMGKAIGNVAYQVGAIGAGTIPASWVVSTSPTNIYAGREFFSGKLSMSPIEKTQFKIETGIRAFTTSNRAAYRDIAEISMVGRFEEPMIKAEPRISETTRAGQYEPQIRSVLGEQQHSMIGSSTIRQQFPADITAKTNLRYGKDVDVLIEKPSEAISKLSSRAGISEDVAKGVMDVHPIPQGYPGFKASAELDLSTGESSLLTRVIGDPYRRVATPRGVSEIVRAGESYKGALTYEASQVQYGRKSAAVAAVIEDPITKGYRAEKDIYDFVTLYRAQKEVSIQRGALPSSFKQSDAAINRLLGRSIEIGTTKGQTLESGGNTQRVTISELFEMGKRSAAERQPPQFKAQSGVVSTVARYPFVSSSFAGASVQSASRRGYKRSYVLASALPSLRASPPSKSIGRSSINQPGSPVDASQIMSPLSRPPSQPLRSPDQSWLSIPTPSPSTPQPTPPGSRPPRLPTISPPSKQSMPPYSPPPTIPYGGGWAGAGTSGRSFAPRGLERWRQTNPVADIPYLSKGMSGPAFGSTRSKRSGGRKSKYVRYRDRKLK